MYAIIRLIIILIIIIECVSCHILDRLIALCLSYAAEFSEKIKGRILLYVLMVSGPVRPYWLPEKFSYLPEMSFRIFYGIAPSVETKQKGTRQDRMVYHDFDDESLFFNSKMSNSNHFSGE